LINTHRKIPDLENQACQNMVAMEISSSEYNDMPCKIVPGLILYKVAKFGSFHLNIENVVNG
jgi:hypothetical protein